jgi:acyl carrier protein
MTVDGGQRSQSLVLRITDIWCEVLEVPHVDADADFLDLGGNSLHAVRIVNRVEDALDIHLSVRAVLEARTVRLMTERVELALAEADQW